MDLRRMMKASGDPIHPGEHLAKILDVARSAVDVDAIEPLVVKG